MNKYEQGQARIQDVIGDKYKAIIENLSSVSPDFANYVMEFVYGDVYSRPGFSDKNRELAAVACMIGQGNTGLPLKAHMQAMLNVGWKKEEVIELINFLSVYAGFPSCVDALLLLKDVTEKGLDV